MYIQFPIPAELSKKILAGPRPTREIWEMTVEEVYEEEIERRKIKKALQPRAAQKERA
jgi:hypothetical protein